MSLDLKYSYFYILYDGQSALNFNIYIYRKGDKCSLRSILELWDFNETKIMSLTEQQIRNDVTNRGPFRYMLVAVFLYTIAKYAYV